MPDSARSGDEYHNVTEIMRTLGFQLAVVVGKLFVVSKIVKKNK